MDCPLRRFSCLLLLVTLGFAGCSSSTPPAQPTPKPLPAGTYSYQLNVANIRALDSESGQYVLWLRMRGDTAWFAKQLTYWTVGAGSLDFLGIIALPHMPDSIERAFVAIEPPHIPDSPTSILMAGAFDSIGDSASMSTVNEGGVGDYSKARASVIFTTQSTDTNRAKSEFYLMDVIGGVPSSSVSNLPIPPQGWNYGLWVLDSNFYPLHKFFYGAFAKADSSDSKSRNDEFPFPGGFNPAPLTDPGARLEVTLEPNFAVQSNHPNGPSPFIILWTPLRRFIDYNDTLNLRNVWSTSAPHGILKLSK